MMNPVALSFTADFYPDDLGEGVITWTFIAPNSTEIGAGLYELRFIRTLTPAEREAKNYPKLFRTLADGPLEGQERNEAANNGLNAK